MLINRPTLKEVESIYKKCAGSNFILLSGGIAVGKTMFAKMLAVDIANEINQRKGIPQKEEEIDKFYEEGYLKASQKVGAYYENEYRNLHVKGKIEILSMHEGYDYDSFVYGIQIETQNELLTINKRKRIFWRSSRKGPRSFQCQICNYSG